MSNLVELFDSPRLGLKMPVSPEGPVILVLPSTFGTRGSCA